MCGLLLNGGFSSLKGFMTQTDYDSVCEKVRLASGILWPLPVILDVSEQLASNPSVGDILAL
jgi:sulfate adenylyltransferase